MLGNQKVIWQSKNWSLLRVIESYWIWKRFEGSKYLLKVLWKTFFINFDLSSPIFSFDFYLKSIEKSLLYQSFFCAWKRPVSTETLWSVLCWFTSFAYRHIKPVLLWKWFYAGSRESFMSFLKRKEDFIDFSLSSFPKYHLDFSQKVGKHTHTHDHFLTQFGKHKKLLRAHFSLVDENLS